MANGPPVIGYFRMTTDKFFASLGDRLPEPLPLGIDDL